MIKIESNGTKWHKDFTSHTFLAGMAHHMDLIVASNAVEFCTPDQKKGGLMKDQAFRTSVLSVGKRLNKKFGVRKINGGFLVFLK